MLAKEAYCAVVVSFICRIEPRHLALLAQSYVSRMTIEGCADQELCSTLRACFFGLSSVYLRSRDVDGINGTELQVSETHMAIRLVRLLRKS